MLCTKVAAHLISDAVANFFGYRSLVEQQLQAILCNKAASSEFASEYQILVSTGNIFGDCEIMWIQTQSPDSVGFSLGQVNQPRLPSFRQHGSTLIYRIGVVAELFVKMRILTDGIQPFRFRWVAFGNEIYLEGAQYVVRNIGVFPVQ